MGQGDYQFEIYRLMKKENKYETSICFFIKTYLKLFNSKQLND